MSAALLAGSLSSVSAAAVAAPPLQASNGLASGSVAEALAVAAKTNAPARVESLVTEDQLVEAMPDGSLRAVASIEPVRVEEGGEWVDIDTDLVDGPDGMLKAATVDGTVLVSAGGDAGSVLASYAPASSSGSAEVSYELVAPVDLPAPSVKGSVAVYPDALTDDVDLVVEAKSSGFAYFFVVRTEEAAASPELAEMRLPMRLKGLTARSEKGGGTALVDASGHSRVRLGTPMMWDANGGEVAKDSGGEATQGPAPTDQVAPFEATVESGGSTVDLVLKPDMSVLAGEETSYPVVIDPPSSNPLRNGWTAVWSNYPNKSFWQTAHSLGAGYEGWEQNKKVRSYFRFPIPTSVRGTKIISAAMNVKQVHAAQCKEHATQVYRTRSVGTATTWNAQPERLGLQDTRYSYAGCGSGSDWVGWDVSNALGYIAGDGSSTGTFMIRGKSETDKYAWKQFDDAGANLEIRFMPFPYTPSIKLKDESGSVACGTSGDPGTVTSTTIQMGAGVSIRKGVSERVNGVFRVENLSTGGVADGEEGTRVASGGESWKPRSVSNGSRYRIRARTRVYWNYQTGQLDSKSASPWCYFNVDTTAPKAPVLESSDFPECASEEDPATCSHSGVRLDGTGSFTIKAHKDDTDVVKYIWRVVDPAEGEPASVVTINTSASAAKTFTFTPRKTGLRKIHARAIDDAGHTGSLRAYVFYVSGNDPVAEWTFDDESDRGANTGRESDTGHLALAGATVSDLGRKDAGLRFTAGAPATATVPGVVTSQNFSVDAWVRVASDESATLVAGISPSGSAFELGYDAASKKWVAGRRDASGTQRARSAETARLGQWTHLAGAYVAESKTMRLYVNGVEEGTVVYSAVPESNATWQLGCGNTSVEGVPPQCATGMVDEVGLWDIAIGASDIADRVALDTEDRGAVSTVADWDMVGDTIESGKVTDRVFGAQLSVSGAGDGYLASVVDGGATVPALSLPGDTGQRAALSWSPMSTATSFSAGALVRIADGSRPAVIAQQAGVNTAAWTLGYRPKTDGTAVGQFYFRMVHADSATATVSEARLDVDDFDQFNAVIGVFDADAQMISIYLNGTNRGEDDGSAETPRPVAEFTASPWQAQRGFEVGNGVTGQSLSGDRAPLLGDIARVKLFAGALTEDGIRYDGQDGLTPPVGDGPVGEGPGGEVVSIDFGDGSAHERVQGLEPRTWGAPVFGTSESLKPDTSTGVMRVDGDDAVSFAVDPWADLSAGFTVECVFRIEARLPMTSERDLCSNKEAGGFGVYLNGGELRTSAHIGGGYQVLGTPAESSRWYHTLTVWDGTALSFFVNGIRVGETAAGGELTSPASTARRFVIGADSGNHDTVQFFAPAVSFAKAAIYARPLSTVEAASLAAGYHTEPPAVDEDPTQEAADVLGVDFTDAVARDQVSGVVPRIWGEPTYLTDQSVGTGDPVGVMQVDSGDAVSFDLDPWADLSASGTDGFTLECVVRIDSMPSDTVERDLCSDKQAGGFGIYVRDSNVVAAAFIGGAYQDLSVPIEAGRWYHIAAVWDGGVFTLYLDGYREAETTTTGVLTPPTESARRFVIGADPDNTGGIQFRAPPSTFARMAIYGRGLTYDEVVASAARWTGGTAASASTDKTANEETAEEASG